jgi:hypothetical protein
LAWLSRHPRGDHPREKGDPQARRGPLGSGSAGAIVLLRAKPGDAVAIRLLFIFASVLARVKTRSEPKVRRLSAGGNWIRTLGSARDRPRLRGSVVHLSAQKSWRSAEGTHSARGTSTGTDVGRASQEGGLRSGLCRDRQGTRPHHSAGRPRDGRLGDRVRRR